MIAYTDQCQPLEPFCSILSGSSPVWRYKRFRLIQRSRENELPRSKLHGIRGEPTKTRRYLAASFWIWTCRAILPKKSGRSALENYAPNAGRINEKVWCQQGTWRVLSIYFAANQHPKIIIIIAENRETSRRRGNGA